MNVAILQGNLTRNPETRYAKDAKGNDMLVAQFSIAVSDDMGNNEFVNCTAFRKTAEFIEKYFGKGSKVLVRGRIKTDEYTDKDNVKRWATKVIVEHAEFCERKSTGNAADGNKGIVVDSDGFMNIPDGDDELPYN